MSLIDFPRDDAGEVAAKMTLTMRDITTVSRSPFNYASQVLDYDAGMWGLTITIPPVGREDGNLWIGFLAALRGQANEFQCCVPGHKEPLGRAAELPGVPRFDTVALGGRRARLTGLPASTWGYLLPGDFIQIGTRLHTVTQRCDTTSVGTAFVYVWPNVINPPAAETRVVVSNAQGLWRLRSPERSIDLEVFDRYSVTLTADEVI